MRRILAAALLGLGLLPGPGLASPALAASGRPGEAPSAEVRVSSLPGGEPGSREEQEDYARREAESAGLEEFEGGFISGTGIAIVLGVLIVGVAVVGFLLLTGIRELSPSDSP